MKEKQIRENIADVQARLDAVNSLIEKEDRSMTDEERNAFDADFAELETLEGDLARAIKFNEATARAAKEVKPVSFETGTSEKKEKEEIARNFSFGKAVLGAYDISRLSGLEKEMHEEGSMEMSRIGQSANGVVIPHDILNRAAIVEGGTTGVEAQGFVNGVYANTILGELGVTRLTTSTDQRIPIIPSVTTQWEGETDAAADGGSTMTKVDLTPKRLASFVDYSKQAAMQHNQSLEAALRSSIQESIGAKVEYALFTDDTANGSYEWLGNGKTAVTGATVTAMVLALMEELQGNNHSFGNLGFAISNSLFSELYQAVLATGVSPLVANNMIMGLPFHISTQIADIASGQETIYYGNWSKVQVAQFGGVEILADPYTQAVSGKNRLILNSYWDAALVQDAAISVAGYTG